MRRLKENFVWELTSEGAPNVVRVFLVVADSPAFEPAPTQFVSRLRVYASMVRRAMLEQIPTGEPANYLYQLVREYPYRPGKHMRAAICLSICEALGGSATGALDIASSLELLHNALLIHDDIEDGSGLRRGEITLHERHGVPLAVNAGDALAMFAVESLHAVVQRVDGWLATRLRAEFNHATRRTVEGQAIELGWQREGVVDLSVDDYVAMATLKTCAYTTVLPMRVGALLANTPPIDLDGFTTLAIPLGLAFQIRDDLLSLEATSGAGKDALGDLYEGKRSLPIIHLLSTSTGPDHDFLCRFLKGERTERNPSAVHEVRALLEQHGSVAFATSRARQFAIEARNRFDETFAPTPSSPALDFLREMIRVHSPVRTRTRISRTDRGRRSARGRWQGPAGHAGPPPRSARLARPAGGPARPSLPRSGYSGGRCSAWTSRGQGMSWSVTATPCPRPSTPATCCYPLQAGRSRTCLTGSSTPDRSRAASLPCGPVRPEDRPHCNPCPSRPAGAGSRDRGIRHRPDFVRGRLRRLQSKAYTEASTSCATRLPSTTPNCACTTSWITPEIVAGLAGIAEQRPHHPGLRRHRLHRQRPPRSSCRCPPATARAHWRHRPEQTPHPSGLQAAALTLAAAPHGFRVAQFHGPGPPTRQQHRLHDPAGRATTCASSAARPRSELGATALPRPAAQARQAIAALSIRDQVIAPILAGVRSPRRGRQPRTGPSRIRSPASACRTFFHDLGIARHSHRINDVVDRGLSHERCFRRSWSVGLGGRPAVTECDGEGVDHGLPAHRPPGAACPGRVQAAGHKVQALQCAPARWGSDRGPGPRAGSGRSGIRSHS